MSKRSATPGLIARPREGGVRRYWSVANLSTKAEGYPQRLIALPGDASPSEIEDLCQTYALRLDVWLKRGAAPRTSTRARSGACATPTSAIRTAPFAT